MGMVTEMRLREAAEGGGRFNYRGFHRYLITLPVSGPEVQLSERDVVFPVLTALREASRVHQFDVVAYCFLPDRLVIVVRGRSEGSDMKKFLEAFRPASTAALAARIAGPLWARKYLERVLRKTENTKVIAEEIFRLPVKAGMANDPSAYPYQGSFVLPPASPARRPSRPSTHRSSRRPGSPRGRRP
jgi:hypothetical protein